MIMIFSKISQKLLLYSLFTWNLLFFYTLLGNGERGYYTLYGNITMGASNVYNNTETLNSFYDTQAFLGDNAYTLSGQESSIKNKFCVQDKYPQKQNGIFRILSFNVHNFHNVCETGKNILRKNPQFIIDAVKNFKPDIALFQEIVPYASTLEEAKKHNSKGPIAVNFSFFDNAMQNLDLSKNIKVNDFEKCNAIFMGKAMYTSNEVIIENTETGNLNNEDATDRGYLRILFLHPKSNKKILLYTVHLSFNNSKRTKKEVDTLETVIQEDQEKHGTKNVVIMGDFNNDPYKEEKIFNALLKDKAFVLLNNNSPTAFNQNSNGLTIDLIWVSQAFLQNFEIHNNKSNEKYSVVVKSTESDHWPIYIDFAPKKIDVLEESLQLLKAKLLLLAHTLKK